VIADDTLSFISKDRVLDFDSEPEDEPFIDELQCPVADETLVALRKAFTLSYPRNPFIDGLTEALTEIRSVCVEALSDMPEVLEELGLPPIPPVSSEDRSGKVHLFKFTLTRAADLRIKVKYEGKSRSLFNLLEPDPADVLIRTAREIVSLTFSEMHSEDQHEAVLRQIRNNIWDVLPAYNEYLTAIEVEPIAAKAVDSTDAE